MWQAAQYAQSRLEVQQNPVEEAFATGCLSLRHALYRVKKCTNATSTDRKAQLCHRAVRICITATSGHQYPAVCARIGEMNRERGGTAGSRWREQYNKDWLARRYPKRLLDRRGQVCSEPRWCRAALCPRVLMQELCKRHVLGLPICVCCTSNSRSSSRILRLLEVVPSDASSPGLRGPEQLQNQNLTQLSV